MTSFLLHQAGIATPKTWVCESRQHAHEIIANNKQLVIKPLFGSQGQGVRLVEANKLPLPMDAFVDGVFYIQHFIKARHDYRVFLVNHQPVAAMRRIGEGWLHNVAQGAQCESIDDIDVLAIATQASLALDIAYCGVDVIRNEDGQLFVLEVNSIPAWRGLQAVTEVNVAQMLVNGLLNKLHE
jgi:RimK family alpha-L-glutamate ligase